MSSKAPRARHRFKDLGLQQLRTFCVVCERGGYAAASRELALTPPAVWEQAKCLETFFELKLLERQGNEVRPTSDGKRLLELVRPVLGQIDSMKELLHQERGSLPASISVVADSDVVARLVPQAALQFNARFPNILLRSTLTSSSQAFALAASGHADIVIAVAVDAPSDPDSVLQRTPLATLDYLLVAPAGHPLVGKKTIRWQDLAGEPLVLADERTPTHRAAVAAFQKQGLERRVRIAVETDSDQATLDFVAAGLGVGIVIGTSDHAALNGLEARSLRRWMGPAAVEFLRRFGVETPPIYRELEGCIRSAFAAPSRVGP